MANSMQMRAICWAELWDTNTNRVCAQGQRFPVWSTNVKRFRVALRVPSSFAGQQVIDDTISGVTCLSLGNDRRLIAGHSRLKGGWITRP